MPCTFCRPRPDRIGSAVHAAPGVVDGSRVGATLSKCGGAATHAAPRTQAIAVGQDSFSTMTSA